MNLVLIDADLIVYEAAFCVARKEKDGEYLNWYQVSKIVNTIMRRILRGSRATHYLGFLTEGHSNFRVKRATLLPYKGQRKTNEDKPAFYSEIRDYLEKHWGCQVMRGVEADDALTIASEHFKDRKDVKTLIATKDKDLWQYPGHHYNMNTDKLMKISESEAHRNLWRQMILGDMSTDNIPGLSFAYKFDTWWGNQRETTERRRKYHKEIPCQTFGKTKAERLLNEWDPSEYAARVYELYLDAWDQGEDDDFADKCFHEIFDLVWMLREAPSGLKINYNPIKVKKGDLEFSSDLVGYRPTLEF